MGFELFYEYRMLADARVKLLHRDAGAPAGRLLPLPAQHSGRAGACGGGATCGGRGHPAHIRLELSCELLSLMH